jgi:hypothetical protein
MGKVKTVLTENGVADAVTKRILIGYFDLTYIFQSEKAKKNKKKETGDSEAKQKKTNPYLLFSKDKRIEFKNSGKLETLENADVMKVNAI